MSGSTAFWYASRATGIVALLLLTAVFVLGILVNRQGRLPGLPRFAVTSLHKNFSLLAVTFIAVHVFTAVLDTYVSIPLAAGVIPFASGYERLWLSLGAISFDLMIAMIVTSLLRSHLNRVLWRAIHLLAYVSWPVAFVPRSLAQPGRDLVRPDDRDDRDQPAPQPPEPGPVARHPPARLRELAGRVRAQHRREQGPAAGLAACPDHRVCPAGRGGGRLPAGARGA